MKNALCLSLILLGLGSAGAAPRLSTQSIIVNPVQPDLKVNVWTDRDQSGTQTPDYQVGEHIRVYTTVSRDAYVYLFNVNPDGSIDQILPNRFASGGNFVKANTVKSFPASGDGFTFDIAAPYGMNKVLALASESPLDLDQVSQFRSGQAFATVTVKGQDNFAQALSIVVTPVPQDSWITDVAYYNVARDYVSRPAPAPAPVVSQPAPPSLIIDITIQPFSGAQNVRTYNEDGGWHTEFNANTGLGNVYNYYDAELSRQGYRVVGRQSKGNKFEARYQRGRQVAKLTIKQKGGRFEVEIERGD